MIRLLITLYLVLFSVSSGATQLPKVSTGTLEIIDHFESEFIGSRKVYVWLPNNFKSNESTAVLYMHDGQMLFDAKTTWNKQEWGVDEVASKLIAENRLKRFIVVGIENAGPERRGAEYFPQNALNYLADRSVLDHHPQLKQDLQANNYLKFLVTELKPYLAAHYAVKTDKANSVLAGSSMGGLISMYAISEYPEEFAAAACLSTHWLGSMPANKTETISQALFDYMRNHLPDPNTHRLYFDHGTETLDRYYPELQERADRIIKSRGYNETNWQTREFVGAAHDENSWRDRLEIPLLFLLKN